MSTKKPKKRTSPGTPNVLRKTLKTRYYGGMSRNRNNDLTRVLNKQHSGKWVALTPNRTKVVAFSEDLSDLQKKVGKKEVVYKKVLDPNVTYAF